MVGYCSPFSFLSLNQKICLNPFIKVPAEYRSRNPAEFYGLSEKLVRWSRKEESSMQRPITATAGAGRRPEWEKGQLREPDGLHRGTQPARGQPTGSLTLLCPTDPRAGQPPGAQSQRRKRGRRVRAADGLSLLCVCVHLLPSPFWCCCHLS